MFTFQFFFKHIFAAERISSMRILSFITACFLLSQTSAAKGKFYLEWGYNKDWFSKSTIHFKGNAEGISYDFTAYDVEAHDLIRMNKAIPEPFVAQYGYRIGYMFNAKHGIEFNYDHAKYVVNQGQRVHMKGTVNETYFDTDTIFQYPFVSFEHTNGANFFLFNYVRRFSLFEKSIISMEYYAKPGFGFLVPKTDITINYKRLDNYFHMAGYIAAIESGFLTYYKKHLFLDLSGKIGFANYLDALALEGGKVNHHFMAYQFNFLIGYHF